MSDRSEFFTELGELDVGIHSDTLEDASERWDQIQFVLFAQQPEPPKSKPAFDCTLCGFRCNSKRGLERHVHEAHGGQHIYLRANGRIAGELHHFAEPLAALECVSIGHERVVAEITTSSQCQRVLVDGKANLKTALPRRFTGEVKVTVSVDNRVRARYLLFFVDKPRLNSAKLDTHIFALQMALERGEVPDWRSFEAIRDQPDLTLFEREYLNGFYEYSLAFHLEKTGQVGSGKFEKALTLLSKVNTRFARTACYVLAIRMNAFQALRDCPEESAFYLCRAFFLEGIKQLPNRMRRQSESETGIYVDGFTERVLQIVRAYYARDFKNLDDVAAVLSRPEMIGDPNNEQKLNLVLARTFRAKGDLAMASRYYDQLSNHPLFRSEAKECTS